MDYKNLIIEYCNKIGLDTIGFTECREFTELIPFYEYRKEKSLENEFEEKSIELRINPKHYMTEGKTIISIAFPYAYDFDYDESSCFSKYTMGLDYHIVIKKYLNSICSFITSLGGKSMAFVDNNTLPERYIACLSGIGFIGKNNMLITKKYGSYVFLGEIITDLNINISKGHENHLETINLFKECGECSICLNSCPTKAINNNIRNSNICLSYITQKKHIEDIWVNKLEGRIFGCDSCQKFCPFNKKTNLSKIEEFKPYNFMKNADIEELIYLDNKNFKEKYNLTASAWRGKSLLQRNALLRYFYLGKKDDININKINSPYVKDYYYRLLKSKEI